MLQRLARHSQLLCLIALVATGAVSSVYVFAEEIDAASEQTANPDLAALRQLLDVAWSGQQQATALSVQLYETHRKQVHDARQWDYAYGLVCLRTKRYPLAVTAFSKSIQDAPSFDLARWKALLWTEFTLKKYDDGLQHLQQLAEVTLTEDAAGHESEAEAAAIWIGQTMFALETVVTLPKVKEQAAKLDLQAQKTWPANLLTAYQSGKDYSHALYDELMTDLDNAKDQAQAKEVATRKEKLEELNERVESAGEQREAIKDTATAISQQLDHQLLQIDKQLARLDRDYQYLQTRAQSLLRSINFLQLQLFLVQQGATPNTNQQIRPVRSTNQQNWLMKQQQAQLTAAQWELELTNWRASLVAQEGYRGFQLRQQVLQQAQRSVLELEARDAELEKWQQRQAQSGEAIKKSKLKISTPTVRQKREQAASLNTYLEFNLDLERMRLTEP